jgi:hypothetical protein
LHQKISGSKRVVCASNPAKENENCLRAATFHDRKFAN